MGIQGMMERVNCLNGEMNIESYPEKGTEIHIRVLATNLSRDTLY